MRYSEQQVNSELLDQPEFHGEPNKIFICSTPRSGSYMLCRYMINADLGIPHEYFNPINIRQIAPRLGLGASVQRIKWRRRTPLDRLPFGKAARAAEMSFLGEYIAALIPRRCPRGIFAAKIHFDQYLKVLDNPVGRQLLDGGLFIYLYREDLLKQAISTHFAKTTGRWGIDDTAVTIPASRPDFFNVAMIDRTLEELAEQDRGWRVFLGRNSLPAMFNSYENLCRNPADFVAAIASRVGIDPSSLREGYSEADASHAEDPAIPSKSEVLRHYLAFNQRVHPADIKPPTLRAQPMPTKIQGVG